jgi:CO/xanthine dehydrogenase FAD-binding subunit
VVIVLQEFDLLRPKNYQKALDLISQYGKKARLIAGGTDLMVDLRKNKCPQTEYVIDISSLKDLAYIKEDNGFIRIGSLTTHKNIVTAKLIDKYAKVLALGCQEIGSPQIRNRGTIGGNIITGSPCADSVTPLVALDAVLVIASKEEIREVPINEFYNGPYKPKINENEFLKEIYFKKVGSDYNSDFIKVKRRNAVSKSRINIAALAKLDSAGQVEDIRLAPGSITPKPQRFKKAEDVILNKKPNEKLIEQMSEQVADTMIEKSGYRWSTEYKKPVIKSLTKRILRTVLEVE